MCVKRKSCGRNKQIFDYRKHTDNPLLGGVPLSCARGQKMQKSDLVVGSSMRRVLERERSAGEGVMRVVF